MLLDTNVRDRLMSLGPKVLFHGTRFLVPIIMNDELAISIEDHSVALTSCPEVAARIAASGPRPFDDGRGAIIALDWARLESPDQFCFQQWGEPHEYCVTEPIHPLSDYIVGIFWLDQLAPGIGLHDRIATPGPVQYPAHPYRGAQEHIWAMRRCMAQRGVMEAALPALHDIEEGGIYGEVAEGPNGLDRHEADAIYASMLPGVRLAASGLLTRADK